MTNCCCPAPKEPETGNHHTHDHSHEGRDWMMIVCAPLIIIPYLLYLFGPDSLDTGWFSTYMHSIHEFVNATWWGVLVGIVFLALLSRIPREFVMSVLGNKKGAGGIARAMAAGVLLDLCNHGILMIGTKIYQRGASIGQVMAFLIASPWNSISLTFILIAMIGVKMTFLFLVFSVLIAFVSGLVFDLLVDRGALPANPNAFDMPQDFKFWTEAKHRLRSTNWSLSLLTSMVSDGLRDSKMVVRWLLAGIVIASVLRVFFTPESFSHWFGPSALGMLATVLFATILEVCSEGSSPIAADFVNRARAPGNAFAFLMAGVSTDYTEIMVMKDATKSWKIALFLPLVTLPQIILLGIMMNAAYG